MQAIEECNIVCDSQGEKDAVERLYDKMPKVKKTVYVGDVNDRGPDTNGLIKWMMEKPDIECLDSNHGQMFVDWYLAQMDPDYRQIYDPRDFFSNGGIETIQSYAQGDYTNWMDVLDKIPREHITWLKTRPLFYEQPRKGNDKNLLTADGQPIRGKHLTGIHWPSMQVYQEPFGEEYEKNLERLRKRDIPMDV